MLTANATPEAAQEAADAGADAFLTKPVGARALIANVDKLLADSEARGARGHEVRSAVDAGRGQVLDAGVIRELRKVCGSSAEFASLVKAFQEEGADLLRRFSDAVRAKDIKTATDCALALRASAVNFGAHVLASRCEWASEVSESDFRSMGQQLIDEIARHYEEVKQELDAIVMQDRGSDQPMPASPSV
jgi:two-component system sensor histidine kinase RpfC